MEDRRALKRRHLIYYLRVFKVPENILLGHLVDITSEGLLLLSENPIPTGQTYRLRMKLPEVIFNQQTLEFNAFSLWSKTDVIEDFFVTGFRIPELDPLGIEILDKLIEDHGFRD